MAYEQGSGMGIWLNPAKQGPVDWSAPAATTPGAVAPSFKAMPDPTEALMGIADTMYQRGKNKAIGTPIGIDELTGATVYRAHPQANIYGYSDLPPNSVYEKDLETWHERHKWNLKLEKRNKLQAKAAEEEAARIAAEKAAALLESNEINGSSIAAAVDMENLSDADKWLGIPVELNVLSERILAAGAPALDEKYLHQLPFASWFMPQDEKAKYYDMQDYKSWFNNRTGSPWGFKAHFAPNGVVNYNLVEAFEKDPYGYWVANIKGKMPSREEKVKIISEFQ